MDFFAYFAFIIILLPLHNAFIDLFEQMKKFIYQEKKRTRLRPYSIQNKIKNIIYSTKTLVVASETQSPATIEVDEGGIVEVFIFSLHHVAL